MYRVNSQIDDVNTMLAMFDGFEPIKLVEFLASMNDAIDAFGKLETGAVSVQAL